MVKELANRCVKFPPKDTSKYSGEAGSYIPVSPQVHRYVTRIIRKSAEIADQRTVGKQLAIALFRSHDRRENEFIQPWIIEAFDAEYHFFVKRAHLPASVDKVPTDAGLLEHFEAFERAFHSLVGPYFSGKDELDAILQDTNSAAD